MSNKKYRKSKVKLCGLYSDSSKLTQKDYSRARALFIVEGCASMQIFTVTSGAFLSGLVYLAGADTAIVAIIAALPTLMNVVQILSAVVFENRKSSKKIIVQMALLQRICLILILFIPLWQLDKNLQVIIIALLYSMAHFCGAFINTGANHWMFLLAQKSKLGRYLGLKDSAVLVASTAGALILGRILDSYRKAGSEIKGFQILGCIAILFCVIDFFCLSMIAEPENVTSDRELKLSSAFLMPVKDQAYRKVLLFFLIWNVAVNLAGPFFAIYMLHNLGLSYFYITLMNMVASAARMIASLIWGKIADEYSWDFVTFASILLLGIAYIGWSILSKGNYRYWLPIIQVLSGAAWGGIGISTFRLPFEHAPCRHRVSYAGFCSAMSGIAGFFAAMLGSAIVADRREIKAASVMVSTIQIVFLLSAIGIITCAFYSKKLKEKRKVME